MKKNNNLKVLLLVIAGVVLVILGFTFSYAANDTVSLNIPDSYKTVGKNGIVSELAIIKRITGVGPWDSDDGTDKCMTSNQAGNDSCSTNNVVRSFDQIQWTLEATMNLKNSMSHESLKGGVLYLEGNVSSSLANVVEWDLNAMKWLEGASVSSDGTKFSGYYFLNENEDTIPGKQTLVPTLKVLGASNNAEIKPTFKISIYGGEESNTVTDTITYVSAAPKYNVKLQRNTVLAHKYTYNFGNGDISGRIYGYGLLLQLYNDSDSKGLKGIEYPKGDITFDLNLKLERCMEGTTEIEKDITQDATPILWNYKLNQNDNSGIIEDRPIFFGTSLHRYFRDIPYGVKTDKRTGSVYDSGNILMTQNGSKINVKISNYKFDGDFPRYSAYSTQLSFKSSPLYGNNVGTFHVSYFQIFVPDKAESTVANRTYYLTVNDSNFSAKSISGIDTNTQMVTSDDTDRTDHVLYRPGSFEQYYSAYSYTGSYLGSSYYSGDSKATIGQKIRIMSKFAMSINSDDDVLSATKFVKFDGSAFEPILLSDGRKYGTSSFLGDMLFNVYYITKPDGRNWISQEEMNNADIDGMRYFNDIESIPNGYICVGVYFESTTGVMSPITGDNNSVVFALQVKETAEIGETYGITGISKWWLDYLDRDMYSITKQNFNSWPAATAVRGPGRTYIKTEYDENGQIVSGTHNLGWRDGQTVLIVGSELSISKSAINAETEKSKTNYDLGKGESIVTYKLEPNISNNAANVHIEGVNLKIVDTIPSGITYVSNSSNYVEPIITNNVDGSTTLTWYLNNLTTGSKINPIIYKAHIDEFTDNGVQFESNVVISENLADGEITKIGQTDISFRTSNNTINVINLENYALHKRTDTPIIEANGEGNFVVTAVNYTDEALTNFKLLDILPYFNDKYGSNFSGIYTVSNITLKLIKEDGNEIALNDLNLYITDSINVRNGVTVKSPNLGTASIWQSISSGSSINTQLTGFAVKGKLPEKTKLEIVINIKTSGNKSFDIYKNKAFVETNSQTAEMVSPIVKIEVIKRSLEGYIFEDHNKDGLKQSNEKLLKGVTLKLLDESGNQAIDINGNTINSVVSDNKGYYKFENIPKGKYVVEATYDNEIYYTTDYMVGNDDTINNKFKNNKTEILSKLNTVDKVDLIEKNVNLGIVPKNTKVTIIYKDRTNNKELGKVVNDELLIGDIYTSFARNFEKYILVERPREETIVLPKEETTFIYYYIQVSGGVLEKHIDVSIDNPINNENILYNELHEGNVGDSYDIKPKEFEGYDLVKENIPNNYKGNMKSDVIEVIYYYKKKAKVVVKYLEENTLNELRNVDVIDGYVGDDYQVLEKDIKDYQLVQIPDNIEGKMTNSDIEVIYYYKKIKGHSPQTGDTSNIILWITLSVIGLVGFIYVVNYLQKKKIK